MNPSILVGLAAGTLVSEDLTSISAGLLSRDGVIGLMPAIATCAAGVYAGDLCLWLLGRVYGTRVLKWGWVARRNDPSILASLGERLDAHLWLAVLASRFLPGSRLPMYLAIGAAGHRPFAFAGWSLLAVLLWTPVLVGLTHAFGAPAGSWLVGELNGAIRYVLSAVVLGAVWRFTMRVATVGLSSRT
jgi:membrane protein DedA with SNARE-associated domain